MKKYKVNPTVKQQRAVENIMKNGGNVSKAMEEAGYSPKTAKTPQKLTESEGYQQLLDEYIPESLILGKLKKGIEQLQDDKVIGHLNLATKVRGMQIDKKDLTSGGEPVAPAQFIIVTEKTKENE